MYAPRGYAFFVPLGGGESAFGFSPTFTGQKYYSKTAAWLRGGLKRCVAFRIILPNEVNAR